jgi:hypothetical protein
MACASIKLCRGQCDRRVSTRLSFLQKMALLNAHVRASSLKHIYYKTQYIYIARTQTTTLQRLRCLGCFPLERVAQFNTLQFGEIYTVLH